jgi:hypothetical protein
MDPIVEIDSDGNGQVTLYRYGKTWRIPVVRWVGQPLPYQPPDNIMSRLAQAELNRMQECWGLDD